MFRVHANAGNGEKVVQSGGRCAAIPSHFGAESSDRSLVAKSHGLGPKADLLGIVNLYMAIMLRSLNLTILTIWVDDVCVRGWRLAMVSVGSGSGSGGEEGRGRAAGARHPPPPRPHGTSPGGSIVLGLTRSTCTCPKSTAVSL